MGRTFSESWHRVAALRVQLRPQVRTYRQFFRGQRWCVLHDPFNNQFFRLNAASYAFVLRLSPRTTVSEAWHATLAERPDDAPGQQDVVELLAQLWSSNLIVSELPADAAALFRRFRKRRSRETRTRLLGAMFARFAFWDPDAFLNRIRWLSDRLFSRVGLLIWSVALMWGVVSVAGAAGDLAAFGRNVLDPSNLPWLLLMTALFKALHEYGHMALCKKFGGEVHRAGIMLMVFTPMPFADTTAAWSFRRRRERVLVGLGGVIVETLLASICAVIWANAGQGLLRDLAFNGMLIGSVSTLLFNLNPLLRFDGYYILSDLMGIPNLAQRSQAYLRYVGERYLFGLRREVSPANDRFEGRTFGLYGVSSAVYRVFLFGSILLFVWDRFLILGMLMGLVCIVGWIVVPVGRFLHYLADSPKLDNRRSRAYGVVLGTVLVLTVFVRAVPLPDSMRADGVLEARRYSSVALANGGRVVEVLAAPGAVVEAGQALLQLEDPELDLTVKRVDAQIAEARTRMRAALVEDAASRPVIAGFVEALEKRAAELRQRQDALLVRAPHAGTWSSPDLDDLAGRWLPRGATVGEVIDPSGFDFRVRIPVQGVPRVVSATGAPATVRLDGQPWKTLEVSSGRLVAASPEAGDRRREQDAPPAFEFRGQVRPAEGAVLLHGLQGNIRFELPSKPLWTQIERWWAAFLERRAET